MRSNGLDAVLAGPRKKECFSQFHGYNLVPIDGRPAPARFVHETHPIIIQLLCQQPIDGPRWVDNIPSKLFPGSPGSELEGADDEDGER